MSIATKLKSPLLWRRLGAALFDTILGGTVGIGIVFVLGLAMGPFGYFLGLGSVLTLWLLYSAGLESSDLQATLGGRVFALQVADLDGRRIGFLRALRRQLVRLVPAIFVIGAIESGVNGLIAFTLAFAFIAPLVASYGKRGQAFYDVMAGTAVSVR